MLEVAITNLSAEDIKGIVIIVYRDKNGNIIKIHNGDIDIACNSKLTHSDSDKMDIQRYQGLMYMFLKV